MPKSYKEKKCKGSLILTSSIVWKQLPLGLQDPFYPLIYPSLSYLFLCPSRSGVCLYIRQSLYFFVSLSFYASLFYLSFFLCPVRIIHPINQCKAPHSLFFFQRPKLVVEPLNSVVSTVVVIPVADSSTLIRHPATEGKLHH